MRSISQVKTPPHIQPQTVTLPVFLYLKFQQLFKQFTATLLQRQRLLP